MLYEIIGKAMDYPCDSNLKFIRENIEKVKDKDLFNSLVYIITEKNIEEEYVSLFDMSNKTSLYVTYHIFGDQRIRGIALSNLKKIMNENNIDIKNELPDYLPFILKLASINIIGEKILNTYRYAIEKIKRNVKNDYYSIILQKILDNLDKIDEAEYNKITAGKKIERVGLGDI